MIITNLLKSLRYDLKMDATDTTRDAELVDYANRLIADMLVPLVIQHKIDLHLAKWITTETTAYVRRYALPSDFKSMYTLYVKETHHTGTATAANATTITLAADASETTDAYNGYRIRLTGGAGANQERYIIDYASDVATVDVAWDITPSTDTTYIVYAELDAADSVAQRDLRDVQHDYSHGHSAPVVYALDGTHILMGPVPGDTYVLYGLYWYKPTAMNIDVTVTANADTNVLTSSTTHGRATGQAVQISSTATLPTGLATDTTYYVIAASSTTLQLATTRDRALLGVAIDFSTAGSGTLTLTDVVPFEGLFDGIIRQYTTAMALNRDEYKVNFEAALVAQINQHIFDLMSNRKVKPGGRQAPYRRSRSL